ncbi:MAG: 3-deoxy-7-phosphoheptulonate synthase, partial [Galactobacter sp.]
MTQPAQRIMAGTQSGPANDPTLDLWRQLPIKQQPDWSGTPEHARAVAELGTLPPLVFAGEVDVLKSRLA